MKKIIAPLLVLSLFALLIVRCGKDSNTGSADKIVGTYSVADTFYNNHSCSGTMGVTGYNIVIQKIDTGTVRLLSFNCTDTIIASVTPTWVTATSTGDCFSLLSGSISGNRIRFTYSPRIGSSCDSIGIAVATKL